MPQLTMKFQKTAEDDRYWEGIMIDEEDNKQYPIGLFTSREKAFNYFKRELYKLIKGKTEFTIIGACPNIDK